jgi:hypothetical protein
MRQLGFVGPGALDLLRKDIHQRLVVAGATLTVSYACAPSMLDSL